MAVGGAVGEAGDINAAISTGRIRGKVMYQKICSALATPFSRLKVGDPVMTAIAGTLRTLEKMH